MSKLYEIWYKNGIRTNSSAKMLYDCWNVNHSKVMQTLFNDARYFIKEMGRSKDERESPSPPPDFIVYDYRSDRHIPISKMGPVLCNSRSLIKASSWDYRSIHLCLVQLGSNWGAWPMSYDGALRVIKFLSNNVQMMINIHETRKKDLENDMVSYEDLLSHLTNANDYQNLRNNGRKDLLQSSFKLGQA